jgi:RNA polymerase sigma factor (TIGR02999 family)
VLDHVVQRGYNRPAERWPLSSSSSPSPSSTTLDELWPEVEAQLRRVAHLRLRTERPGHTLSTTALIHETYLRLASQRVPITQRGQFFALAARAMRRILIDYARRHKHMRTSVRYHSLEAEARDSASIEIQFAVRLAAEQRADELLALDEALERLALADARQALVVQCRFFAGYTEDETAEALGVTPRTVARDWAKAKAWLYRELHDAS